MSKGYRSQLKELQSWNKLNNNKKVVLNYDIKYKINIH